MKKIGWMYNDKDDKDISLQLVALSRYEISVLEKILEERDLDSESSQIGQWADTFRDEIKKLNLPVMACNTICRSLHWQTDLYRRDGVLMSFSEWRNLMISTNRRESPSFGVRNLGEKGYLALVSALKSTMQQV